MTDHDESTEWHTTAAFVVCIKTIYIDQGCFVTKVKKIENLHNTGIVLCCVKITAFKNFRTKKCLFKRNLLKTTTWSCLPLPRKVNSSCSLGCVCEFASGWVFACQILWWPIPLPAWWIIKYFKINCDTKRRCSQILVNSVRAYKSPWLPMCKLLTWPDHRKNALCFIFFLCPLLFDNIHKWKHLSALG